MVKQFAAPLRRLPKSCRCTLLGRNVIPDGTISGLHRHYPLRTRRRAIAACGSKDEGNSQMPRRKQCILSPIADAFASAPAHAVRRQPETGARAVGFIDNSKPNVSAFTQALARELGAAGESDIVNVAKPRSAGPSPDIAFLADRCRFVVNAVAD